MTSAREQLARRLAAAVTVQVDEPGLYWAAVAVILVPDPDALLLIRRAHREGDPWSGHMALPGGRREPADPDLAATAIRETREEVGIHLKQQDLLGALDDVAPATRILPPVAVRPFVFALPARPSLVLNPEVAAAEWLDLDILLDPSTRQQVEVVAAGVTRRVPAFVTPHGVVWGMTERILRSAIEAV